MSRPILLDYAIARVGDEQKFFQYDYSQDMNVLIQDITKLFIDADSTIAIAQTQTRVERESDDDEYSFMELASKTEVSRERDDEDGYFLSELSSKTFAGRERDDEDDHYLN